MTRINQNRNFSFWDTLVITEIIDYVLLVIRQHILLVICMNFLLVICSIPVVRLHLVGFGTHVLNHVVKTAFYLQTQFMGVGSGMVGGVMALPIILLSHTYSENFKSPAIIVLTGQRRRRNTKY